MIAWSASDWSLSDLLKALGYAHNDASFGSRKIRKRGTTVHVGGYESTVDWLCETGQIAWTECALERKAQREQWGAA